MPLGAGLCSIIPLAAGLPCIMPLAAGLSSIIPLGAGVLVGAEVAPAGAVQAAAPSAAIKGMASNHCRPDRLDRRMLASQVAEGDWTTIAAGDDEGMTFR